MKTSTMTYRQLHENDLPEVVRLETLAFSTPWTAEQYAAVMRQGGCVLFGAFYEGRLAGYIAVAIQAAAGEMEVYNIAVAENFRRNGIGKKILGLALAAAVKNGVTMAFLDVRTTNAPAIALYESLGFIKAGVRKGYYPDTGEDALVYACPLS